MPYAYEFFSDLGFLPRMAMVDLTGGAHTFSIMAANGQLWFQYLVLVVAFVVGLLLMVGWRTRLMTILGFLLVISFDGRNPMVSSGADLLMRMTFLWAIFLPLGRVFSLDRVINPLTKTELESLARGHFSAASIAMLVQVCLVYISTVYHKDQPVWREEFTALYYALALDDFRLPLGDIIFRHWDLMRGLNILTLIFEFTAPLLLLCPFFNRITRMLGVLVLWSLHLGFGSMLWVGMFPFIGITSAAALMPARFYTFIGGILTNIFTPSYQQMTVYFDKDCGLCQRFVRFCEHVIFPQNATFTPLPHTGELRELSGSMDSWVGEIDGKIVFRSAVFIKLLRQSCIFKPLGLLLDNKLVKFISDIIYKIISKRRLQICTIAPKVNDKKPFIPRWIRLVGLAIVNIFVLLNISVAGFWVYEGLVEDVKKPRWVTKYAKNMRLDQSWNMFSPPPKQDGWYIIRATLNNNTIVDAWREKWTEGEDMTLSYDKPESVVRSFIAPRWHKYLRNMANSKHKAHRLWFGKYMCRQWNERYDDPAMKLWQFDILYMQEKTRPYWDYGEPKEIQLSHHECSSNRTGGYDPGNGVFPEALGDAEEATKEEDK